MQASHPLNGGGATEYQARPSSSSPRVFVGSPELRLSTGTCGKYLRWPVKGWTAKCLVCEHVEAPAALWSFVQGVECGYLCMECDALFLGITTPCQ